MNKRSLSHRARTPLVAGLAVGLLSFGMAADAGPPTSAGVSPDGSVGRLAASDARLIPFPGKRHFVQHVTNRYLPLTPGSQWVYRGHAGAAGERIVVRVLKRTRMIQGVRATVVSDQAFEDGKLVETTRDWYAQDDRGRVWYLGEATKSFADGQVSTAGSWEAGEDGAKPGVVMFPNGRLNRPYYQEYFVGEAEDVGSLLDRESRVVIGNREYRHVRITKDITALDPQVFELKFYAPGVGLVLELGTSPAMERIELVSYTAGR